MALDIFQAVGYCNQPKLTVFRKPHRELQYVHLAQTTSVAILENADDGIKIICSPNLEKVFYFITRGSKDDLACKISLR